MDIFDILTMIGVIYYMFVKDSKRKDIGMIPLGFATLMFGMFRNPIVGVVVGAALTTVLQSSSASVGILQTLSATGAVSYAAAIPIRSVRMTTPRPPCC